MWRLIADLLKKNVSYLATLWVTFAFQKFHQQLQCLCLRSYSHLKVVQLEAPIHSKKVWRPKSVVSYGAWQLPGENSHHRKQVIFLFECFGTSSYKTLRCDWGQKNLLYEGDLYIFGILLKVPRRANAFCGSVPTSSGLINIFNIS